MKRVGVLGGGQLGTMLAGAIHDLGAEACIYEPDPGAPACARFRDVVNAPWTDEAAMRRFFDSCDVVTYEMEHIDTRALKAMGQTPLLPSVSVLETTQDRAKEKHFLARSGLPHVTFRVVSGKAELLEAAKTFPFPFIVKTVRGGYDGKGQNFVASEADLAKAAAEVEDDDPRILEEAIDLLLEVSCIVGRSRAGEEVVFPVFENAHSGHILDLTLVPARISPALSKEVQAMAIQAARALDVRGLLTTEFFVSREQKIYVNEFAPRPHNSGHVTRNACTASQYDLLARILLDVPISEPSLVSPGTFCMGNLLGDVWLEQSKTDGTELDLSALKRFPEVIDVVLYGKKVAKTKRKMGHYVTWAEDAERAMSAARAFRETLSGR
jgi:5-(carboxyamino)imidazole ribonucleotide synthase